MPSRFATASSVRRTRSVSMRPGISTFDGDAIARRLRWRQCLRPRRPAHCAGCSTRRGWESAAPRPTTPPSARVPSLRARMPGSNGIGQRDHAQHHFVETAASIPRTPRPDGAAIARAAGVVDQDVDRPERLRRRRAANVRQSGDIRERSSGERPPSRPRALWLQVRHRLHRVAPGRVRRWPRRHLRAPAPARCRGRCRDCRRAPARACPQDLDPWLRSLLPAGSASGSGRAAWAAQLAVVARPPRRATSPSPASRVTTRPSYGV